MSVSEARALGLSREAIAEGSHVVVARPTRAAAVRRLEPWGSDVKTGDGTLLPLNTDAGFGVGPPAVREAQGLAGRWAPTVADFQAAFAAARNRPVNDAARAALDDGVHAAERRARDLRGLSAAVSVFLSRSARDRDRASAVVIR